MIDRKKTIAITGAAGFIGSCLASFLHREGYVNLILVDDFSKEVKSSNTSQFSSDNKKDRTLFIQSLQEMDLDLIIHLGARTDTTEMDYEIHKTLNLDYSKTIWDYCTQNKVPLIYASSAATYGGGEYGYSDSHETVDKLVPLNPYGLSKQQFDQYVLQQKATPPFWYGLKFFNVFGPNEYHKGRMASVIFHAYNQIKETEGMKLFRSHNPNYKDGEQIRDFVYVKDVLKVIFWLMNHKADNGIYNLGSGTARTFLDLVKGVFNSLDKEEAIRFIDTPEDIRDKYQYFTEADMSKLIKQGYPYKFYTLEKGIQEYVQEYLMNSRYF